MDGNNFLVESVIAGGWPSMTVGLILILMSVSSLAALMFEMIRITRNINDLPNAIAGSPSENSVWLKIDQTINEKMPNEEVQKIQDRHLVSSLGQKNVFTMTILASVGANAPYIGLLGTVLGVHGALGKISEKIVSMSEIAPPIGEALAMTALGLLVAIPAVMGFNMASRGRLKLSRLVEAYIHDKRLSDKGCNGSSREITETINQIKNIKGKFNGFRTSVS